MLGSSLNKHIRGRVELVIGRLGYGKTTFAAQRVQEIARNSGRKCATTGIDWPESEWPISVNSFEQLDSVRNCVLLLDEIHLWSPSVRGVMNRDYERELLRIFSLLRKRGICVVGTTQAYTRVSTHVRQLVTSVWMPKPIIPGTWHRVQNYETPEDGGAKIGFGRSYSPKWSEVQIPTNAEVWLPTALFGDDTDSEIPARSAPRKPALTRVLRNQPLTTEYAND